MAMGQRDYQEDALATDFPLGTDVGFAVLADGMGGHAAGDMASKIVVTEMFCELKFQSGNAEKLKRNIGTILRDATENANECVRAHTDQNPNTKGMGATLIAPVLIGRRLYWISVGDSPLYLFRGGRLRQINEDHSLAPQIDLMVESGLMSREVAENHPDRNALTSVLMGAEIERIDCPEAPVELRDGDIVIAASDGLQFLTNEEIEAVVRKFSGKPSEAIAEALLLALEHVNDPGQDNVSFTVIRYVENASRRDVKAEGKAPEKAAANAQATGPSGSALARLRGTSPKALFQSGRRTTGEGTA